MQAFIINDSELQATIFHNKQQYFQNKFLHLHLCYFRKISGKTGPNKYKAAYFNLKIL